VSAFRLYIDEDASSNRLVLQLRARDFDVLTAFAAGLNGKTDEEQLVWASESQRVIYTFNVGDFCRLHQNFARTGREHGGIIVGQQRYSIGEQLRRLSRLLNAKSAKDMRNSLEFLSDWG
jgi:hypothetical protein